MPGTALIPIDNRPVCYRLPKMTAALDKEHRLFLPDINCLGDLTKTADADALLKQLSELKNIDNFIISLDTIAYGGLIPSRRSSDSIEEILKRTDALADILKKHKAKVYAFSSIMRISNNNINEEEKEYWKDWGCKIFEYSYNFHKNGQAKTDVPPEILEDYLNTRKRNFEINKYYIELKKQGIIDTLVFSKDDCAGYGLNVMEAEELKRLSQGLDDVFIKTGADEIPLTLLSRALNKEKNVKICPKYTHPDSIDKISRYEDISVKQSVKEQIELAGGIVSDEKNCDIVLLVNNFEDEQGELVFGIDASTPPAKDFRIPDKPFCTADIVNANGADKHFVKELLEQNLTNFYGYAGWNTTGNTLGSVLAAALTYFKAQKPDKTAFNKLQTVRFLDDWAYQSDLRALLKQKTSKPDIKTVRAGMKEYEEVIIKKFPAVKEINYSFPWNRFFEIEITISPHR